MSTCHPQRVFPCCLSCPSTSDNSLDEYTIEWPEDAFLSKEEDLSFYDRVVLNGVEYKLEDNCELWPDDVSCTEANSNELFSLELQDSLEQSNRSTLTAQTTPLSAVGSTESKRRYSRPTRT